MNYQELLIEEGKIAVAEFAQAVARHCGQSPVSRKDIAVVQRVHLNKCRGYTALKIQQLTMAYKTLTDVLNSQEPLKDVAVEFIHEVAACNIPQLSLTIRFPNEASEYSKDIVRELWSEHVAKRTAHIDKLFANYSQFIEGFDLQYSDIYDKELKKFG